MNPLKELVTIMTCQKCKKGNTRTVKMDLVLEVEIVNPATGSILKGRIAEPLYCEDCYVEEQMKGVMNDFDECIAAGGYDDYEGQLIDPDELDAQIRAEQHYFEHWGQCHNNEIVPGKLTIQAKDKPAKPTHCEGCGKEFGVELPITQDDYDAGYDPKVDSPLKVDGPFWVEEEDDLEFNGYWGCGLCDFIYAEGPRTREQRAE